MTWLLWDALLAPLGCPWALLGPLGTPRGALGVPWGAFLDFDENWTSLSEQMVPKYHACHQNIASRNSSVLIRGIRGIPGNGPNRAGPDLCSTRSGGKDDGSLHKLPQTRPQDARLRDGKTT